jgi:beta-hydroxylase
MVKYPFIALLVLYAGTFACIYARCRDHLPLKKYLSNHVLLLAPLNFLFTFFTAGRIAPVLAPSTVPGLDCLRDAYPLIRQEAKTLLDTGVFQRPPAVDEPGYNTFEKGGWRLYPIKWYAPGCNPAAAAACPRTCAVIDSIPSIRAAMFTVLPPGGRLGRHHDPIASSLRYHLGLVTPNSDRCALMLDGVSHAWRDGEELLFDQTYLHSAANNADTPRVILFCDVEKTQLWAPVKALAEVVNRAIVAKFTGANEKGKLSWVSWAYKPIYKVRSFVKEEIRPRSPLAYNVIKFGSIALALFMVYLAF